MQMSHREISLDGTDAGRAYRSLASASSLRRIRNAQRVVALNWRGILHGGQQPRPRRCDRARGSDPCRAIVRLPAFVGEDRSNRSPGGDECLQLRRPATDPANTAITKPTAQPQREGGPVGAEEHQDQATPLVAPKPRIETPPVQQIADSETPQQGLAPTQGASNVRGPGTGAGGLGNGTGSGSGGNGRGGGGDNGVAEPPHLATPVLRGYDFPRDLLGEWPPGATVFLRLRVDARGTVAECLVDRGTGIRSIDSSICNIAHERLRFRPALNRGGQAVAGWFGYAQPAPR